MCMRTLFIFGLFALWSTLAPGQEDTTGFEAYPVLRHFESSRIGHMPSVETQSKQDLEMLIAHRFTQRGGPRDLFGLDGYVNFRLGLEYGIIDRLTVGLGRNREGKMYDTYLKAAILRQKAGGEGSFPFALTVLAGATYTDAPWTPRQEGLLRPVHRWQYNYHLIIARQFGARLSVQTSFIALHRNLTYYCWEPNTLYATGVGAKVKLTPVIGLTGEYVFRWNQPTKLPVPSYAPGSFGVDFNTARHAFQLLFTNVTGFYDAGYLTGARTPFYPQHWLFGFNIVRTFGLGKG